MATVLIVEDDEALRDSFSMILDFSGHEVQSAVNGEAALELLAVGTPDVILLDILMPVMDGREFLKNFDNKKNTPIVALSNLDAKADIEQIISLGAKECHLKSSITPEKLIQLVSTNI